MVNARSHGQNLPLIDQSATAMPPPSGPAGSGSVYLLGRLDQSRRAHLLDLSPIVRADDACFAQIPANVAAFRRYEIGRETRIALGSNGTQRTILYRSLHADEFSRFVRQIPTTDRVAE